MAGKVDKRRSDLKAWPVDIAATNIEADGIDTIEERLLTREARCSLGAIYNLFNDLVMKVKTREVRLAISLFMSPDMSRLTKRYWAIGILMLELSPMNFVRNPSDERVSEDLIRRLGQALSESMHEEFVIEMPA